ncbi:hypothetical protein LCGC14_2673360 [marine sediment metagenome]|uniref:Uncharacterized protein n=1 Tax=marine sediment metagenome TaxID=412755 RepID=A0A0F8ZNG4_9ZZZZ
MKFKLYSLFLFLILFSTYAFAEYTITRDTPGEYYIENSTTVLFNFSVIDTGGSNSFNCSVYNKTNRTGAYSLGVTFNTTNNTYTNNGVNLTFTDNTRTWWYIGCYDTESEFSTTLESQTVPAIDQQFNLTFDANGVNSAVAIVNYSQDNIHEGSVGLANNSEVGLAGNATITVISASQVNTSTDSSTNESATIPANATVVANLTGDGNMISVTSVYANISGTFDLVPSSSYSIVSGSVNWTNASYVGNDSLWIYKYYSWIDLTANTHYTLNVTSGIVIIGPDGTYNGTSASNNTRWNYTFLNETSLTTINYNTTNGFVFINTSTYEGDTSYWNYSYPFNSNINQTNTTVRIFDIDDYYYEFISIFVPIRFVPQSSATCDSSTEGAIYYDTEDIKHYGCNSTDWRALY